MGIEVFKKHLRERRAIKISIGNEMNLENVAKICRVAQNVKASAVDITGIKGAYEVARKYTKLPLFISSYHPFEILEATKMGVDGIQIGNYSDLYENGTKFSADEIYDIILESMAITNKYNIFTSVVIPATLDYEEKIDLLKKLSVLGVDLIQSEGYKSSEVKPNSIVEDSQLSISNMMELTKYIRMPFGVTCVTKIEDVTYALENGAFCATIEYQNKKASEVQMQMDIMKIVSSVAHKNSLNREIVRTKRELSLY